MIKIVSLPADDVWVEVGCWAAIPIREVRQGGHVRKKTARSIIRRAYTMSVQIK